MVYIGDSTALIQVIGTADNRSLHFNYTDGRITPITLFSDYTDHGVKVSYKHDDNGNLTVVSYSDGSGFRYSYMDVEGIFYKVYIYLDNEPLAMMAKNSKKEEQNTFQAN